MSTTEQNPLWVLDDQFTGIKYRVWADISDKEARKFVELVDKLDGLLIENPSQSPLITTSKKIRQLQKIGSDIIFRCLRISDEDFAKMTMREINMLVGQFILSHKKSNV